MKSKPVAILLSILSLALLNMTEISPSYAVPEIYITPSDNPPEPGPYLGFKWNITLWTKGYGTPPVFAWQVRLNYDPASGINATRAWIPRYDLEYILPPPPYPPPEPIMGNGTVLVNDSLLLGSPGETPPPDPAKLAVIEFQIIKAPGKYENLTTVLDMDNFDTFLLDDALNSITVTIRSGSYTWVWPSCVKPYLAVVPTLIEMNPAPHARWVVGRPFDIQIHIKDLFAGWGIVSASFGLTFNYTVINIIGGAANVTINTEDWNKGPPSITVSQGRIDIGVATNKTLSDVLIATIRFTVLCQQYSPPSPPPPTGRDVSPLDLINILLEDSVGPIPTDPEEDGMVYVYSLAERPDVAVTDTAPCFTEAHVGWEVKINVTATNYGMVAETFSVTTFYDSTPIEIKTIVNLEPKASITTTFNWNTLGVPPGNYTIKAEASIIPGESYIENNIFTDGIIKIKMQGDVNGDNKIDIRDIALVALAFGSVPNHPRWNIQADINQDGKIDIRDIALVASNFGETFP